MGLLAAERLAMILDLNAEGFNRELQATRTKSERELGAIEGGLDRTGKRMQVAGIGAMAFGAALAVGLYKATQAYESAQKSGLKLDNSIRNSATVSASARKAFDAQADSLHNVTAADDDAITSAQALLVQMGLTEQQVTRLIPLIVDLARKKGITLDQAAQAVGKSVTGTSTALRKMGIVIDETAFSTDAYKATMDALAASVGGFARGEANTLQGKLEILKNQLGDIAENVGKGAEEAVMGLVGSFGDLASSATLGSDSTQEFAGQVGVYVSAGLLAVGATSTLIGTLITARTRFVAAATAAKEYAAAVAAGGEASAIAGSGIFTLGATAAVVLPLMAISYANLRREQEALTEKANLYTEALRAQGDEIANLNAVSKDQLTANEDYGAAVAQAPAQLRALEDAIRSGGKALDDLSGQFTSGTGDVSSFVAALKDGEQTKLSKALIDLYESGKLTDDQFIALVGDLGDLSEAYKQGTSATQQDTAATEKNAEAKQKAAEKASQLDKQKMDAFTSIFAQGQANVAVDEALADAERARADAAERAAQADRNVAEAGRAVAEAHQGVLDAINELPAAYQAAEDALASLQRQERDGALSIREATLNVADAKDKLAEVLADPNASDRDKERAQIALERAQNSLTDATERQADTEAELNKRRQQGRDGAPEVQSAIDRIKQAKENERDATERLRDAEKDRSKAAEDSAEAVDKANGKILGALGKQQEQVLITIAAWRELFWALDPSKVPDWVKKWFESGEIPGITFDSSGTPSGTIVGGQHSPPVGGRSATNINVYVDGSKTRDAAIEAGARKGTKAAIVAYNRRVA